MVPLNNNTKTSGCISNIEKIYTIFKKVREKKYITHRIIKTPYEKDNNLVYVYEN